MPPQQDLPDGTWEGGREVGGVVEISGHFTIRPSAGMTGVYFRSCPVAAVDRGNVWPLAARAHRMFQGNALHLLEPEPSNALIEAVETVARELAAVDRYEQKRDG